MSRPLAEELGEIPAFADLAPEQLAWLASKGDVRDYASGDVIFEPGADIDSMVTVLQGAIEVMYSVGGQLVPFTTQRQGMVTGLLPYSRLRSFAGSGHAAGDTRLFRLHQSHFDEMLRVAPSLGPRLVALMTDRVRESTRLTQQREKMIALGKLAAGLAHEINNPAAAVGRAADLLRQRLARLPAVTARLVAGGHERTSAALTTLTARFSAGGAASRTRESAVARAAREAAVTAWLDARGVEGSWMVADTLVDAGVEPSELDAAFAGLTGESLATMLEWLDTALGACIMAADIHDSSTRISELVGSIKLYSHMDRASVREPVNVRDGLDNTLVMMGHKVKKRQVTVERVYAPDLPAVHGLAGELNQVWTNLVDNALDAMPGGGTLRLEAERDGRAVVVRVIDSGDGIPPENLARIFEAFFTTKPVGEGTGLGLDIVQRIVCQQHGGRVDVESRPGRTMFSVRLPVDAADGLRAPTVPAAS